ncbi:MAG TPA: M15 family metallopeptidase [Candidatus Saccharimonadales bacterium]|nr:M15 family metallopeptidase [Candidatus Saccharimonadales bacterium]
MKIRRHKKALAILCALVLIAVVYLAWPSPKATAPLTATPAAGSSAANRFDKSQYSLTEPSSIWVVVNKQHPLQPIDYAPSDLVFPAVPLRVPGNESMQLRQVTAKALEQMFAGAKLANINLQLSSGYRSYSYQVILYNSYVKADGRAQADQESARPGYSEHQTGLAVDLEPTSRNCELQTCFAATPEGKWLSANAYKYGFILRYTPANQAITGYESEPWHFRYVGPALAGQMHGVGITTLEQFFEVSGGSAYSS